MKMRSLIWILLTIVGFYVIGTISAMGGMIIHEYFNFPWPEVYSTIVVGLLVGIWYGFNILYSVYFAYNLKNHRL